MPKPLVFISHITEEKPVATALKTLIQEGFLDLFDVFVSSDGESIRAGAKWLDNISDSLKTCVIEFVVCSPQSIRRPWINFEAGAGWVRDIPIIPICHSGLTPEKLPTPLNMLQAVTATDETQLRLVLPVIAGVIRSRVPNVDFTNFVTTIREFEIGYVFWDLVKAHVDAIASALGAPGIDLRRALNAVAHGERPFGNANGGVDGMCLKFQGNLAGELKSAFDFLNQERILEVRILMSAIGFGLNYSGPVTTIELQPLERFIEVFAAPQILT